jgi:hypothetical protein
MIQVTGNAHYAVADGYTASRQIPTFHIDTPFMEQAAASAANILPAEWHVALSLLNHDTGAYGVAVIHGGKVERLDA